MSRPNQSFKKKTTEFNDPNKIEMLTKGPN